MAYHTNDKITDGLSRLDNFLPKRKIFQKHRRQNLSRVKAWRKQLDDLHGKTSIATAKKFLNQRSAYSIRKTSIFSDAFRLTVVNFFMELYKLTRNVARRKKLFEGHGLGFLFSSRTSRNKLQNVNIILLGASPDATDAFSDASIVYYSSKRCMYNQHF